MANGLARLLLVTASAGLPGCATEIRGDSNPLARTEAGLVSRLAAKGVTIPRALTGQMEQAVVSTARQAWRK